MKSLSIDQRNVRSLMTLKLLLLGVSLLTGSVLSAQSDAKNQSAAPTPLVDEKTAPDDQTDLKNAEVYKLDAYQVNATTGTNLRGVEPTGAVVLQMSLADIAKIGAVTTDALLETNTAISTFQSNYPGNGDAGGSVSPSIHGVAEGETLVLINGHRLPGSGYLVTAADPTAISPGAIARVDVIPDGASAIYGSDAVEGVINLILRQDFNGFETTAHYGLGSHFSNYNLGALYGKTWKTGSFLAAYQYNHNSNLEGKYRSFFRQDLSAQGGTDHRSSYSPGRVVDANGTVLSSGTITDIAPYFDIIPESKRHNFVTALNQKVNDQVSADLETFIEKRNADWIAPAPTISVSVPANNPYLAGSPYASAKAPVTVTYDPTPYIGKLLSTSSANVYDLSGGGKVKLPADWNLALDSTYGWSKSAAYFPTVDAVEAQVLANNTTTGTALNPFGASADSVNSLLTNAVNVAPNVKQSLFDNALKADGDLYKLPGGEIKAAFGVGYRSENYNAIARSGSLTNPLVGHADVSRNVSSVFTELLFPLVGPGNRLPGVRRLSLSIAARSDHYSDFGNTTNPKYGMTWSIVKGFDVRASWGTSFHAPRLSDIGTGVDTRLIPLPFYFLGTLPPGMTTAPANSVIIAGGTLGLKPERATTWSTGLDFKPTGIEGLKLSATLYNITFKDNVGVVFTPNFSNAGDNRFWKTNLTAAETAALYAQIPQIPGQIYPTQIAYLADVRRYNLGTTWTSGIDLDLSYHWLVGDSSYEVGLSGNFIQKYDVQQTPGSSVVDYLGTNRAIKNKARVRFSWNRGPYGAAIFVNRTNSYLDTNNTGNPVDSYTTVDFHLSYDLGKKGIFKGMSVALDASNLFNQNPPFVNVNSDNRTSAGNGYYGFDGANASPIGRVISLSVKKAF